MFKVESFGGNAYFVKLSTKNFKLDVQIFGAIDVISILHNLDS